MIKLGLILALLLVPTALAQEQGIRFETFNRSPVPAYVARTGEMWSVYGLVEDSEGNIVEAGGIICIAKVADIYIPTRRKSFSGGIGRCVWKIPEWGIGRFLVGSVTIGADGFIITRDFAARIREGRNPKRNVKPPKIADTEPTPTVEVIDPVVEY